MNRRKLLGTVIISIFAGCSGTEEGTQTENNSPASMETDTPTPTETDGGGGYGY